ncbi:MAG: dihydropyrimidinase [Candidatus Eisenbacteria bacterium]|nr:dihydropyrimidinase [Candidatus Eisenbacteria bacterium]
MAMVIKDGLVVTAQDSTKADVRIEGEKIAAVGQSISPQSGEPVIDARGKYVLPGGIDVHTHMELPFGGTVSADDFHSGTVAAAAGGTTTIIDFAIQGKGQSLRDTLDAWKKKAGGKAVIDYGFHVAIGEMTESIMNEMKSVVEGGCPSFKLFLAYKGLFQVDDGTLYKAFLRAKEIGALICIHAENGDIVDVLTKKLLAEGKTEPKYHAASRPPAVEAEATGRAIAIAAFAGAPVYIVHLTAKEALAKVREARARGEAAYAETCPQYLLLSSERYDEPNFGGAKYVMSPPLRPKEHNEALWQGLQKGDLQAVSTDHCPFNFKGQKDLGKASFNLIPNGLPGVETRLHLLYTEGVTKGRFSVNKFVDLVSTTPAKLFGLFPEKGTVQKESDADIVIFDPNKTFILSAKTHHQKVDYNPYEGFVSKGTVDTVISRGEVVFSDGSFLGKAGRGRFLKRKPFSAKNI